MNGNPIPHDDQPAGYDSVGLLPGELRGTGPCTEPAAEGDPSEEEQKRSAESVHRSKSRKKVRPGGELAAARSPRLKLGDEYCPTCHRPFTPKPQRSCFRCGRAIGKRDKWRFEDGRAVHRNCEKPEAYL